MIICLVFARLVRVSVSPARRCGVRRLRCWLPLAGAPVLWPELFGLAAVSPFAALVAFRPVHATCPQGHTSSSWNPVTQRGPTPS
jgi:hypothetical protein